MQTSSSSSVPVPAAARMAHELTRRGLKVVLFEAGKRQSLASFSQNPGEAFGQLTWLEPRSQSGTWDPVKTSPTLPAWHCRTVGGTTVHWTAATPRLQPYEVRARSVYGDIAGASLADWPIDYAELKRWYEVAEKRIGVTRRNGNPGMPASNNFKVMYAGARRLGYKRVHTNYLAINSRPRDGRGSVHSAGLLRAGLQDRRQVEHAVHRDSARRGQRQARPAQRMPRHANRARRCGPCQRRGVSRRGRGGAAPAGAHRVRRRQRRRDRRACCCCRSPGASSTVWPTDPTRWAATTAITC